MERLVWKIATFVAAAVNILFISGAAYGLWSVLLRAFYA